MLLSSVDKIVAYGLALLFFGVPLYLLIFASGMSWPWHSKSINEANEKDTFICRYTLIDSRKLSEDEETDYVPRIKECFCERLTIYGYHKDKLYSDKVEYCDSIVYTTLILDDDKNHYDISNSIDRYSQISRPSYSTWTETPIPDTISIIISHDSIPLVSYTLKREY